MTLAAQSEPSQRAGVIGPIGPIWHTACLLALLAIFSGVLAYLRMGSATPRIGHVPLYSIVIAFEWAVFAFSLWHSNAAFARYVESVRHDARSLRWDIPVAVLLSAVLALISPVVVRALGPAGWVSLEGMAPKNSVESVLWIVMAISAGICEETVFRGYLQQQIAGWTHRAVAGLAAQAAIFGLCHAYQGWKNMALIFVWGCGFGACAWLRKGLRANMIAHAALDILSGF
jgi:uncharacterized protein